MECIESGNHPDQETVNKIFMGIFFSNLLLNQPQNTNLDFPTAVSLCLDIISQLRKFFKMIYHMSNLAFFTLWIFKKGSDALNEALE